MAMMDTGLEAQLVQLQHRIDTLLSQAQNNEEIQQRCHQLELALIASNGLGDYLHQLFVTMPSAFNLDAVSLHLHDPEHITRHLLEVEGIPTGSKGALQFHNSTDGVLAAAYPQSQPLLHVFTVEQHSGLFDERGVTLGSVAILPLHRGDQLLGMLNLGSIDPDRFTPERATDFLQHLAAIAAVCLENAINQERLRNLGLTDALTGVRNRRYFEQRVLDECRAVQRHNRPLACLFLDLDHFKQINDNYGHHNGDRVLQRTASCVSRQLRDSDLLCRFGGEEFVVLLLDTDIGGAKEVAERIRSAVAGREFELSDKKRLRVTLSIGIAVNEGGSDGEAEGMAARLVEGADAALYQAKSAGRNCVMALADCQEEESGQDDIAAS